jgi:hypothetical protein
VRPGLGFIGWLVSTWLTVSGTVNTTVGYILLMLMVPASCWTFWPWIKRWRPFTLTPVSVPENDRGSEPQDLEAPDSEKIPDLRPDEHRMQLRRMLRQCCERGERLRMKEPSRSKPPTWGEAERWEKWSEQVTDWGVRTTLLMRNALSNTTADHYIKGIEYTADRPFIDAWLGILKEVLDALDDIPLSTDFDARDYPEKPC